MTNQFKRIIAREGLVLLGIVGISFIIMATPELYIKPKPIKPLEKYQSQKHITFKADDFKDTAKKQPITFTAYDFFENTVQNQGNNYTNEYTPLTKEQFDKEQEAGFSYDEIVKYEEIRKATSPVDLFKRYNITPPSPLKKFREKYPEYNDIDDLTLVTKLARKYPQYNDLLEKVKSMQNKEVYRLSEVTNATEQQNKVRNIGLFILLFGYPIYWLIRFIIWAIRTLKEKE